LVTTGFKEFESAQKTLARIEVIGCIGRIKSLILGRPISKILYRWLLKRR
jgi:hypothetical protein